MSNQPSAVPVLPENAPFTPAQRSWLNGFFAGVLSLEGGLAIADRLAPPSSEPGPVANDAVPDETEVTWHDPTLPLEERMRLASGRTLGLRMMAAMAQQDCGQCGYNCADYAKAIVSRQEPRLSLCAPGGKETARMLRKLYEELAGAPAAEAAPASPPAASRPANAPGRSRERPVEATFRSRHRLNGAGSGKETYHVDIDLTGTGIDYAPGDSLGVVPANDPELVSAVLDALRADGDFPLAGKTFREVLTHDMSLGAAPDILFTLMSYITGGERRERAKALAAGEDPDGDAATLDVLAALHKFPGIHPDPEAFVECLEPLQPRLYSISSSPRARPGHVSLTVDCVRYEVGGRPRLGAASTFLAQRIAPGGRLPVFLQKAHGFALPEDGGVPIVMIGPGTGVAPFRAFLQERLATGAAGKAWLFFGHQHEATDFFYREEIEGFLATGTLTRLSTAWSRDGGRKVYVQDRMREAGAELWAWLAEGAHLYVCGDAKRMARDVDAALVDIVATQGGRDAETARRHVAELRRCGRYRLDVY
jgi:sulfite reductase (NADPH) flavoprotein alpha-component